MGAGGAFAEQGRSLHEAVQFGFGMFVAYVERHHAFLRGALDWKFSHRTYMILVETMTRLHGVALSRLGDQVPTRLRGASAGRSIAGSALALAGRWLAETEQQAAEGEPLDATSLLEEVLLFAPGWYTGLGSEDPIPAAELLEVCRSYAPQDVLDG